MAKLGVNIDHVATLRQARGTKYPDPLSAALLSEKGGADQITVHLREDRRHIQDFDVRLLKKTVQTELNLEMAVTPQMFEFAVDVQPNSVTFVPEKREELTTEGGLNVAKHKKVLSKYIPELKKKGIRTSLFIEPDVETVKLSHELGSDAIEIHTGTYAEARIAQESEKELARIIEAVHVAKESKLWIAAGHGLHYQNVQAVAALKDIVEFNIGHSIIARAIFVGIEQAVREMKKLLS